MSTLNELEKVIVAKAIKASEVSKASSKLDAGHYLFDVLIRITGKIRRGENHEASQPHTVRYALLAALFASKVNDETFESVMRLYETAIQEKDFSKVESQFKDHVKPRFEKLATKAMVNGKTTTDMTCEVVGDPKVEYEPLDK